MKPCLDGLVGIAHSSDDARHAPRRNAEVEVQQPHVSVTVYIVIATASGRQDAPQTVGRVG